MKFAFNKLWELLLIWGVTIVITSFGFCWLFVYEWNSLIVNLITIAKEINYWSVYPQLTIIWFVVGLTGLKINKG